MNSRQLSLLVVAIALTASVTWWIAKQQSPTAHPTSALAGVPSPEEGGRKILFYQSAMHPWIKSDKPGKCTICGMPLTPVFEGQQAVDADSNQIVLSSSSITVAGVQSEKVIRQPLHKTLRVAGLVEDNDTQHRRLSAVVDGRIEELHIQYTGAEVVQGQPLATFHSLPLLALEKEYVTLLKQLTQAPEALRPELEKMRKSAENRLSLMGLTQGQIATLSQRPEEAHLIQILSPMSGTVVSREVYAGQYVKEGDKLFEIADFSTMWFKFDAYERDLAWLKLGQSVDMTTPSVPGKVYKASIRFIDPNVNESTRSAKVRVEVPNPLIEENGRKRRELFHRLYAEGTVELSSPEVLTVPRTAVLNPNGRPVVYVDAAQGHYEQRAVRLGRLGDHAWEVLEGLQEGERVVTMGNLLLDSQAQLNAGNTSSAAEAKPASTTPARSLPLSADAQKAVRSFLDALADAGSALASDDLERFNVERKHVQEALPPFVNSLKSSEPQWQPTVEAIQKQTGFPPAADLAAARAAFHPLAAQVAELFKAARANPGLSTYKLFQCPMTSKLFPGAPKTGVWLQKSDPIRNPYFGADMLDCGTEVKP